MKTSPTQYSASFEISNLQFQIFASQKGITRISLNKNDGFYSEEIIKLHPDDPYMFGVYSQLKEYFNRERRKFKIPLDTAGTEFQKRVWNELIKIPYGKTISYLQLSENLGNLKLTRAAGGANSANPVPIIVPCHRVINSDGSISGYSGGIYIKEKLLELEGTLSLELFENSAR
jgi:methylated-DNA-[protein]-cysteine S-methyltransferase